MNFIKVPSFRSDIKTQNDLAEEVARVIGYDNISRAEINIPKNENHNYKDIENKLRYFLLDYGFYEVINSPFVGINSKEAIKVDNPLDSNRAFLRTNLTDSLVENLLFNERRQKDSVKLFEISDIYSSENGIHKKRMLSIIASGRVGLNYQDFSKRIDKKYLTAMFQKILPNEVFDFQILSRDSLDTKIKSEIISLEVNIERFSADILSYKEVSQPPESFAQFNPISDLPSSTKDLSYLIKDFSKIRELENLFLSYQSDIVKNIFIFDYFHNEKDTRS
jgi:phenylalanyl-tRNA synthetase beta chain